MSEPRSFLDDLDKAKAKWPYIIQSALEGEESGDVAHEFLLEVIPKLANASEDDWGLKKLEYKMYIDSREWALKAKATKERFGNRCALCNDEKYLNAHHRTYKNLYHEKENDLICLCKKCHSKHHNKD